MTTHFTSGVTNVSADGSLGKIKQPDPTKYHLFHEDFDKYTAADWVITTTEAGSGAATEALAAGDGGLLVITNDDADNDADFLQWAGGSGGVIESFKYETGKQLFFKSRFKTSDADATDIVMGLQITDTAPLDVSDGIFFLLTDGDATPQFIVEKNGSQTTLSLPNDMADDTFMTLGFVYNPADQKFHVFQNNVLAGTVVSTNAPDDEELAISFGVQNGAAAAKVLTVDYITAGKERTAVTEL
tara:strand:- start:2514 stop:3242 length:729 start_codon:yes stop_codon:yes gene_type:complete